MNQVKLAKSVGRPTRITAEITTKLESVFKLGVTDKVAINYAGIGERTYYDHLEKDPKFRSKMQSAQDFGRLAAGNVVMDAIVINKDLETAKWWLAKKYPAEFSGNINQINIMQKVEFVPYSWYKGQQSTVPSVSSAASTHKTEVTEPSEQIS